MLGIISEEKNIYAKRFYEKLHEEGYKLIEGSNYINAKTKVNVKCPNNHEWDVLPLNFIYHNRRCRYCAGVGKKTHDEYVEELLLALGESYTPLEKYIDADTPILIKHLTCGFEWKIKPNHSLRGVGCPRCISSKGERFVRTVLIEAKEEFIEQYKDSKCSNIKPLPFDFALFDDGELLCLIEYQGIQHYKPVEFFGGIEKFLVRVRNDNIKREFCKSSNIPLIEISYNLSQKDVRDFLMVELEKIRKRAINNVVKNKEATR